VHFPILFFSSSFWPVLALFFCAKVDNYMDPFQNRAFGTHVHHVYYLLNGEKAKTRVERVLVFLVYMNIM